MLIQERVAEPGLAVGDDSIRWDDGGESGDKGPSGGGARRGDVNSRTQADGSDEGDDTAESASVAGSNMQPEDGAGMQREYVFNSRSGSSPSKLRAKSGSSAGADKEIKIEE